MKLRMELLIYMVLLLFLYKPIAQRTECKEGFWRSLFWRILYYFKWQSFRNYMSLKLAIQEGEMYLWWRWW